MADALHLPIVQLGIGAWSDIALAGGWRLQRHARSGRCRLVDPRHRLVARGGYAEMLARWQVHAQAAEEPRDRVLLLHGLTRTARIHRRLEAALAADGFEVIAPSYASTRQDLDAHVRDIRHLLDHLPGCGRISLVGHSLGGLIVHRLLAEPGDWKARLEPCAAVLITVPHEGSRLGARVSRLPIAVRLLGPALADCLPARQRLAPADQMPRLNITGGTGRQRGFNPWLAGDNDLVLTADEMHLDGATLEQQVRSPHGLVCRNAATIAATRAFLALAHKMPHHPGDADDLRAA